MRDCFVSHLFLRLPAADSPDGCLPSIVVRSRDADSLSVVVKSARRFSKGLDQLERCQRGNKGVRGRLKEVDGCVLVGSAEESLRRLVATWKG